MRRVLSIIVIVGLMAVSLVPRATARSAMPTRQYGDLQFPADEHQHGTGWDYYWGAADLVMESGNRYTVGIAFVTFNGYSISGHQVFPRQGPYAGRSIMTVDGPEEWGHPGEAPGQYLRTVSSYVPGVSELLKIETYDVANGFKNIGKWERTSRTSESLPPPHRQRRGEGAPERAARRRPARR